MLSPRTIAWTALLLLAGCKELREPAWDIVIDPDLDADAVIVRALIRSEGCTTDPDAILYEQQVRPRPAEIDSMPQLDEGDYCFEAIAEDASCNTIGDDPQLITIPLPADARIVNLLDRLATPRACEGVCTPGGCLLCDGTEVSCDGPPRCCPIALGDDPCAATPLACRMP